MGEIICFKKPSQIGPINGNYVNICCSPGFIVRANGLTFYVEISNSMGKLFVFTIIFKNGPK